MLWLQRAVHLTCLSAYSLSFVLDLKFLVWHTLYAPIINNNMALLTHLCTGLESVTVIGQRAMQAYLIGVQSPMLFIEIIAVVFTLHLWRSSNFMLKWCIFKVLSLSFEVKWKESNNHPRNPLDSLFCDLQVKDSLFEAIIIVYKKQPEAPPTSYFIGWFRGQVMGHKVTACQLAAVENPSLITGTTVETIYS